jgi:small neutral amino acid transporter SnatA (MarC family)
MPAFGLLVACAIAGAINVPALFVIPLTAAGMLMLSAPRIIEKIRRSGMLQQTRVTGLAITLFGMNAVAVAAAVYLVGRVLWLVWT